MEGGGVNEGPSATDTPDRSGHVLYERAACDDFVSEWLDATTGAQAFATTPGANGPSAGSAAVNLLCVSASVTVDEWVGLVDGRDGVRSAGVVSVGDGVRSATAQSTGPSAVGPSATGPSAVGPTAVGPSATGPSMAYAAVGDLADLSSVGLAVEAFVDDWDGNGARSLVCLDALPSFFDRREEVRVLRFVAALLAQLEHQSVAVHAVVDPDAIDVWTLTSLASLFGTVDRGESDDA